jgi:cytoskeleton protein RodZ
MADEQLINSDNVENTAQVLVQSLGATLQAARLEKKLSQQDASNSLRYSVKQIDALENNAFGILPDPMMTRGFIRSYAKYLEIDAEPLLAAYRKSLGDDPQKVFSVKSSMRPVALTKESLPWLRYILASIVVLLFLLAWMAYVEYMPKQVAEIESSTTLSPIPTYSETNPAPTANPSVEPLPEVALPEAERTTDADASAALTDATPEGIVNASADASTSPQATQAAPAAQLVTNTQVATNTQAVTNAKNITFVFSGQSWVRVMDTTGKVIYEKLSHSGETDTIQAVPPLNVVVGNASETKLNFSGQEIDLTAKTKNNVARVTLE